MSYGIYDIEMVSDKEDRLILNGKDLRIMKELLIERSVELGGIFCNQEKDGDIILHVDYNSLISGTIPKKVHENIYQMSTHVPNYAFNFHIHPLESALLNKSYFDNPSGADVAFTLDNQYVSHFLFSTPGIYKIQVKDEGIDWLNKAGIKLLETTQTKINKSEYFSLSLYPGLQDVKNFFVEVYNYYYGSIDTKFDSHKIEKDVKYIKTFVQRLEIFNQVQNSETVDKYIEQYLSAANYKIKIRDVIREYLLNISDTSIQTAIRNGHYMTGFDHALMEGISDYDIYFGLVFLETVGENNPRANVFDITFRKWPSFENKYRKGNVEFVLRDVTDIKNLPNCPIDKMEISKLSEFIRQTFLINNGNPYFFSLEELKDYISYLENIANKTNLKRARGYMRQQNRKIKADSELYYNKKYQYDQTVELLNIENQNDLISAINEKIQTMNDYLINFNDVLQNKKKYFLAEYMKWWNLSYNFVSKNPDDPDVKDIKREFPYLPESSFGYEGNYKLVEQQKSELLDEFFG